MYSNPKTTYSQLMVMAHKAEIETEEVKDKVRARSATATEVVDGSNKLDDSIARLMATLTRAEQTNCLTSVPNSPRHRGHGRGQMDRNTPTHPSSHNGQTGLGSNHLCLQLLCCKLGKHCFSRKREYPRTQWYPEQCPKHKRCF